MPSPPDFLSPERNWRAPLASARRVLIASDFDGTLAPIVDRPEMAEPLPEALSELAEIAARPEFRLALVSGRALTDLRSRCNIPGCWYLGGHGNETQPPLHSSTSGAAGMRRDLECAAVRVRDRLPEWPGTRLEAKPFSLALHFRQAPQWLAPIRDFFSNLASEGDFRVLMGRKVVELLPAGALTKGQAVNRLRSRLQCDLAFYFGDDTTDEDVFGLSGPNLIGVKVAHHEGRQPTAANYSVDSPQAVVAALAAIRLARTATQKKYPRLHPV